MTDLKTLFPSLSDMMRYATGIDASNSIDDLTPSALYAFKRIHTVVPSDIVELIAAIPGSVVCEALRQAVANATMAQHITFQSIHLRKSGTDIYKYELESMRRGYNEAYYAGMDSLLAVLMAQAKDADPAKEIITRWQTSRFASMLASCRIRTCEEMDAIMPIDLSYLFFFRTLPLQRESLNERLEAYYAKSDKKESLDLALVKSTVAKALRRFDPMEFPATMRNLLEDCTASRSAAAERQAAVELAQQMEAGVAHILENIDMLTSEQPVNDFMSMSGYNRPGDKIIIAP